MNTTGATSNTPDPDDQAVGQCIGPYKLMEKIGVGGYGVVYVAEQQKPIRRRVAVKVIKMGMDTKQVVARFEAERQALAMMDHPNIAKVLDAGATDSGRPYFVMELVRGIKITDYCDQNKLSTTERLDLFIKVCHAVQHAHQKGIIHRDLKPSNIMVTLHDGIPVPKVIDFGIAKATETRLTDLTLYTQLYQFVGTPAYVSPEQAEMSGLDVDTRSDIYSLGVILYELLTGTTPFDNKELMSLGVEAMRHTIRDQEPQRPSTRLSTLTGEELTSTAKRHGVEAPHLMHSIRGDLDWIVIKCLEKDRTRRYETVNGLVEDIKRHLANEPVVARPPSSFYRFQTFVRRNRMACGVGATVAAVLIVGTVVSTHQAVIATRARAKAQDAKERDALGKKRAEHIEELIVAKDSFLSNDFVRADTLVNNLPPEVMEQEFFMAGPLLRGLGHWHAGQQRWHRAADYFDQLLSGPVARKFENLYQGAAFSWSADPLSLDYQPFALLYPVQALLLIESGDRERYELFRRAVIAKYGDVTDFYNGIPASRPLHACLLVPPEASDRVTLCRWVGLLQFQGDNSGSFGPWLVSLFMHRRGEPEQSLKWAQRCLGLKPGPAETAIARTLISIAYWELGREDPARRELAECRGQIERKFSGELGVGTYATGRWDDWLQARLLLREADQLMTTTSPGEIPARSSAGATADSQSGPSWDEAMDLAWDQLVQAAADGDNATFMPEFGWFLGMAGKTHLTEPLFRKALQIQEDEHGREGMQTTWYMNHLSGALGNMGKYQESERLAREVLARLERNGVRSDGTVSAFENLAKALRDRGDRAGADAAFSEALSIQAELRNTGRPPFRWEYFIRWDFADFSCRQGRYAEAAEVLREAVGLVPELEATYEASVIVMLRKHGITFNGNSTAGVVYLLADALVAQGKYEEAGGVCRQEVARREALSDQWPWKYNRDLQQIRLRFYLAQIQRLQDQETDLGPSLDEAIHTANPMLLIPMAWSLSTQAEPERRGGAAAVRLAAKAVEVTGRNDTTGVAYGRSSARSGDLPLSALAAAYAEAGDFFNAIKAQRELLGYLSPDQHLLKGELELRLKVYEAGMPYHDVPALEANARRLLSLGDADGAEAYAKECLALRRILTPEDWSTYNTMSLLGAIYLAQGNYDEAKPLLVAGYNGLQEREDTIPAYAKSRIGEAREHLDKLHSMADAPHS